MSDVAAERHQGARAWAAVLRCHAALVPVLSRRVEREAGLPLAWYDVLLELQAAPERRLRITELGERVVLSRSRVSRVVDDLSAAGLVERTPDPTDRRAAFAVLTAKGAGAYERAAPIYLSAIQEQFAAHLSDEERRTVATALERVTERHS